MLIIKNVKIISMVHKDYDKADIAIHRGKIQKIARHIEASFDDAVMDCSGLCAFPGIVDAHSHIGMWEDSIGFEGADGNEDTNPITPNLRAIDAINPMDKTFKEAYQGGVTTVCTGPGSANVISGTFSIIKTYGHRIDDMILVEPYALKVAFGENPKRVYSEKHKTPSTRMATAALLREALLDAENYVYDVAKNPEKRNFGKEAIVKVLKREIPLKVHAHRADDIFTAVRIANEFNINITLDHFTEGYMIAEDIAKEKNVLGVIVGPLFTERSKPELKNLTFKAPKILAEKGMMFAMMTDHPVIPEQHLPVCAALAVKEGLDEYTSMQSITINPARILGIDDRVGSLEEGKDADIVLCTGHPLDFRSKIHTVMIDGKIVHEA